MKNDCKHLIDTECFNPKMPIDEYYTTIECGKNCPYYEKEN